MNEQVIVHCPACGVAFTVAPELRVAKRFRTSIVFSFGDAEVDHECKSD